MNCNNPDQRNATPRGRRKRNSPDQRRCDLLNSWILRLAADQNQLGREEIMPTYYPPHPPALSATCSTLVQFYNEKCLIYLQLKYSWVAVQYRCVLKCSVSSMGNVKNWRDFYCTSLRVYGHIWIFYTGKICAPRHSHVRLLNAWIGTDCIMELISSRTEDAIFMAQNKYTYVDQNILLMWPSIRRYYRNISTPL